MIRMVPKELTEIVNDIFNLTGKKVDHFDPMVVAALFQATCIAKAGEQAAASLTAAANRLENACEKTRIEGVIAQGRHLELIHRVPTLIKDGLEMNHRLAGEAVDQASVIRPAGVQRRDLTRRAILSSIAWFVAGVAFASAAGFMTGYLSASHAQDAAVGRAFGRALPFLRPDDKARLLEEIKKQQ